MASPPTGTLTFLFTDIEGSTKMWERDRQTMSEALARHDRILRDAVEQRGGYVFKTVGDAFCCAFPTAPEGLEAALEAQHELLSQRREEGELLKVRMALHEAKDIPRDIDFLAEADARISAVRSGMGEEAWEKAWRQGRAMTLDEAVSYALKEEAGT